MSSSTFQNLMITVNGYRAIRSTQLKKGDRVGEGGSMRAKTNMMLTFVLWKPPELDGVGWDAPFGHGRPGLAY